MNGSPACSPRPRLTLSTAACASLLKIPRTRVSTTGMDARSSGGNATVIERRATTGTLESITPSSSSHPLFRHVLTGALLATAGTGLAPLAAPAATADTAPPAIHVAGDRLVDAYGATVRLLGVNRSGTEYACIQGWGIFDGPNDAGSVAAMASWHINAVRVPLNEDCWLNISGVNPAYGAAPYQNAIVNYVNLLHQRNLYVILDLHWNAPGTQRATGQQPMPDADHSPAFWQSVATRFKADPAVVFDLYNEPYGVDWNCWLNGCSAPGWPTAGMQQLVSEVRGAGASNVIMLGGLSYANDLTGWLSHQPTDSRRQLVASFHTYNFNTCNSLACWNAQESPVAAQVPLVTGEIGENDCAHGFIDAYMAWADSHAVSYLGWTWDTWNCSSGPALISNYNGTPTSFGVGFRDHLLTVNP